MSVKSRQQAGLGDIIPFNKYCGPTVLQVPRAVSQSYYGGLTKVNNTILPLCPQPSSSFLSLPVPTPLGWTTIGQLQIGDSVFDENGSPVTVISISPIISKPCYDMVFSDGNTIKAGIDSQWLTWTHNARKAYYRCKANGWIAKSSPSVVTAQEIKNTLTIGSREDTNHSVMLASALQYSKKDFFLDPYMLGLWLGDGTSTSPEVATSDNEIIDSITSLGYEVRKDVDDKYLYYIGKLSGKTRYRQCGRYYGYKADSLSSQLRALGLYRNKHIPEQYFYGSVEQRQSLLMGLMDTDGTIGKSGSCTFDNTNKSLADAVAYLAVSLGIKIGRQQKRATLYGKDCGIVYRVWFTPQIPVFRLSRKLQRQQLTGVKATQYHRYIVDVHESLPSTVRSLKVASESGIFLVSSGCILTYGGT